MSFYDFAQIAATFLVLLVASPVLGSLIYSALESDTPLLRPFRKMERVLFGLLRINGINSMGWLEYGKALILFNLIGLVFVFLVCLLQGLLPLNPQNLPGLSWHLAFNTAVSFVTNTNWQSYSGESTLSYFSQQVALAVQNFLSAGTGIAVLMVLARGLGRGAKGLGNFWRDLFRSTTLILLPLSILFAVFLISQGVVQNYSPYTVTQTLENQTQTIPQGPAASQISIKQLGTNGGGFFGVNSAHPFENPTPLSNWLQLLAILLLPSSLVFTYGSYIGSRRQSWSLFSCMFILLNLALIVSLWSEYQPNVAMGVSSSLEGKETRIGVTGSILWSVFTSAASNGSVNAMHASLSPLAGGVALFNILLGEIVFGGVGAGLYGMLLFVLLTVFLCGLMVGRTPEYLGKKIEGSEIQMVILGILLPSAAILIGAGISAVLPMALSSLANRGPHGLTEILYTFASAGGNNGSAFAGLNANTPYYNVMLGLVMLIGRFGVIVPVLAIAGAMVGKRVSAPGPGTMNTDSALFVFLLIGVILVVGGLTFLPALALGPIVEHFLMNAGQLF